MGKKDWIYLGIIFVLAIIVSCGATYIVMDKKGKQESNNDNSQKQEEKVVLTDSDLKNYLSYVPYTYGNKDYSAYSSSKVTIDTLKRADSLEKNILLEMALLDAGKCFDEGLSCPFDTSEKKINADLNFEAEYASGVPLDYVNSLLSKMYNYRLDNLKSGTSQEDVFEVDGMGYFYQDGTFLRVGGGSNRIDYKVSNLDEYTATAEELVIYEYAANFVSIIGNETSDVTNKLIDYATKKEKILNNEDPDTYNLKNEFTKYKHTFKKGANGYYWYSTEVAN